MLTEAFADDSYWLGPQRTGPNPTPSAGAAVPLSYFVIDLGAAYKITHIELFNTSNGHAQDRGTGQFTVQASNSLVSAGALGSDLASPVTLVSGTLLVGNHTAVPGQQPVVAQPFLSSDPTTAYRYLRFDALTSISPNLANNGAGLDEIRVFVPEPVGLSLLALAPFALLRRSSRGPIAEAKTVAR